MSEVKRRKVISSEQQEMSFKPTLVSEKKIPSQMSFKKAEVKVNQSAVFDVAALRTP